MMQRNRPRKARRALPASSRWRHVIALALPLLSLCPAHAEEVVKETPGGGINWTTGIVYADGYGTAKSELSAAQRRILSRRAAIVDGQRNLLEMTKGVRITSEERVSEAIDTHRVTVTRIEGIVKGAVAIKENYQNDIFTVTLAMPMAGDFLRAVYPEKSGVSTSGTNPRFAPAEFLRGGWHLIARYQLIPAAYGADAFVLEDDKEARTIKRLVEWLKGSGETLISGQLEQSLITFQSNSVFSGLLINAQSVPQFELATVPKIRNEDGDVIYPSESTSYDDIVNKRGVSYDFDLNDAVRNQRVAKTPFIIKAISTYKALPSDLVISNEDAEKIELSTGTREAMNKAGVLIVVAI